MADRINMIDGNLTHFTHLLTQATKLGYEDAKAGRKRERTAQELMEMFCTKWRNGHAKHARSAYSAGRFQYRMEVETQKENMLSCNDMEPE